ncbi:MAG: hypothetical protein C0179_06820 [Fervidicoccus sp.]|nr:MAG: hypothetical protein C0179_06820 [Fervidicoccus sp.]
MNMVEEKEEEKKHPLDILIEAFAEDNEEDEEEIQELIEEEDDEEKEFEKHLIYNTIEEEDVLPGCYAYNLRRKRKTNCTSALRAELRGEEAIVVIYDLRRVILIKVAPFKDPIIKRFKSFKSAMKYIEKHYGFEVMASIVDQADK